MVAPTNTLMIFEIVAAAGDQIRFFIDSILQETRIMPGAGCLDWHAPLQSYVRVQRYDSQGSFLSQVSFLANSEITPRTADGLQVRPRGELFRRAIAAA